MSLESPAFLMIQKITTLVPESGEPLLNMFTQSSPSELCEDELSPQSETEHS